MNPPPIGDIRNSCFEAVKLPFAHRMAAAGKATPSGRFGGEEVSESSIMPARRATPGALEEDELVDGRLELLLDFRSSRTRSSSLLACITAQPAEAEAALGRCSVRPRWRHVHQRSHWERGNSCHQQQLPASGCPSAATPHLPADRSQAFIKVFDGRVSSSSLRAVSIPATGSPLGSSLPICTSTLAWSQ